MSKSKPLQSEPKRRGRPPGSADISTLSGILKEMAATYRAMKSGKMQMGLAKSLIWSLTQLRDTVVIAAIEPQLLELEVLNNISEPRLPGSFAGARLHS